MNGFEQMLSGGDLRSIGNSNEAIPMVENQHDFDSLFAYLFSSNRLICMRAADAIEKISRDKPQYLIKHCAEVMNLSKTAGNGELIWHLAQLIPRLQLSGSEHEDALIKLREWATAKSGLRIVRVNALQAIFDMSSKNQEQRQGLKRLFSVIESENIPSLNARISILRKQLC